MNNKKHCLIQRNWKSNKNQDLLVSSEGCLIDFSNLKISGVFSMENSPTIYLDNYTLEEEFILYLGFKLHFYKNENNEHFINESDYNLSFENIK
jgi:hypothetical protein